MAPATSAAVLLRRRSVGMTADQAARLLGLDRTKISNIETGIRTQGSWNRERVPESHPPAHAAVRVLHDPLYLRFRR
ncbi:helix-turn-helix domain-containing protein [Streptomyces sp. NPDC002845]